MLKFQKKIWVIFMTKSNKNTENIEIIDYDEEKISDENVYEPKYNEIIPQENYTIQQDDDFSKDIEKIELKVIEPVELETEFIKLGNTGNFLHLKESAINIPVEMIVFPFFTHQKQNRRVNFQYSFEDLGVVMKSTLILQDKDDQVFQPSIFEEKIFTYLISMYEEKYKLDNSGEEYIEFEISDFIVNFLNNKMNRAYYKKVEQALKNLKSTQYQFIVSNYTKMGKYKFEDEEFRLISYKKLKIGKKIFYRVKLNDNITKKIKSKRYIKYNTKNLLEIMDKDLVAVRIYKYISQIRYDATNGEVNLRTLAAIIPLRIEQSVTRETKNGIKIYPISRMKQVLTRILKAFQQLKDLGYLLWYEEQYMAEKNTYYIKYEFDKKRDGDCHISEYVNKNNKKESSYNQYSNDLEIAISSAKTNTFISKAWNKRVDNKIQKIVDEFGEDLAIHVMNAIQGLNSEIETSLVSYMNGIIKKIKSGYDKNKNIPLQFGNAVKDQKGLSDKKQINQYRKKKSKLVGNPLQKEKISKNSKNILTNNNINEIQNLNDLSLEKNIDTFQKNYNITNLMEKISDANIIKDIEDKTLKIIEKSLDGDDFKAVISLKKSSKTLFYQCFETYIKQVIEKDYKDLITS